MIRLKWIMTVAGRGEGQEKNGKQQSYVGGVSDRKTARQQKSRCRQREIKWDTVNV